MKTDEPRNSHDVGKNSSKSRSVGLLLLVLPPVLVGLLFVVVHMINSTQASRADAPGQGSMLTLFVVLMGGIVIGIVAMAFGLNAIIRSSKK